MADLKTLYDGTEINQVDSTTFRNSVTGTTGIGPLVFNNGATLTGTPISVTPIEGDESNKIATTEFVANKITQIFSSFDLLTLSGTTHTLNVGAGKYFDGGTLVGNTNVVFTNIPAGSSKWKYTFDTGWDVTDTSNVVYNNSPFSVASQETGPSGVFLNPDGTKMYVVGISGDDINQYTLPVPWDVTTGVTFDAAFSVTSQDPAPYGIFFKPDGTKMYVVGSSGEDVNQYTLPVPWDVTSQAPNEVTFDGSFSVSGQDTLPIGIFFKPDGTKMYVVGNQGDDVHQYTLPVPWDVTSQAPNEVTLDGSFSVSGQDGAPIEIFFKPDGTKMYVVSDQGNDINQYTLPVPWDVTSQSPNEVTFDGSFSISGQETVPTGIFFKPDGTRMYITGIIEKNINQYDISPYTISLPTSVRNFDYSAIKPGRNTLEFYTVDGGTNVYISKHYIS